MKLTDYCVEELSELLTICRRTLTSQFPNPVHLQALKFFSPILLRKVVQFPRKLILFSVTTLRVQVELCFEHEVLKTSYAHQFSKRSCALPVEFIWIRFRENANGSGSDPV